MLLSMGCIPALPPNILKVSVDRCWLSTSSAGLQRQLLGSISLYWINMSPDYLDCRAGFAILSCLNSLSRGRRLLKPGANALAYYASA